MKQTGFRAQQESAQSRAAPCARADSLQPSTTAAAPRRVEDESRVQARTNDLRRRCRSCHSARFGRKGCRADLIERLRRVSAHRTRFRHDDSESAGPASHSPNILMRPSVASRKATVSTPASVTGTLTNDCPERACVMLGVSDDCTAHQVHYRRE